MVDSGRSARRARVRRPEAPRLLLVDDDETMRRSTERSLTRAGFAVTTAASGAEALARVEAGEAVDVFVVDFEMRGMNGLELLERLAEAEPDVPRGLWSASSDLELLPEEDLEHAWFVTSKLRPIGELVQAACQAVYGRRRALGGGHGAERRPPRHTRSGWRRRQDVQDAIDAIDETELSRGSSSR